MNFEISVPRRGEVVSLWECLKMSTRRRQLDDYRCDKCGDRSATIQQPQLPEFSKYLIVQAERIRPYFNSDGTQKVDENGNTITDKVHTKIQVPGKVIDLSGLAPGGEKNNSLRYELFGMVNHIGSG